VPEDIAPISPGAREVERGNGVASSKPGIVVLDIAMTDRAIRDARATQRRAAGNKGCIRRRTPDRRAYLALIKRVSARTAPEGAVIADPSRTRSRSRARPPPRRKNIELQLLTLLDEVIDRFLTTIRPCAPKLFHALHWPRSLHVVFAASCYRRHRRLRACRG
jgi:hypothetical protein